MIDVKMIIKYKINFVITCILKNISEEHKNRKEIYIPKSYYPT